MRFPRTVNLRRLFGLESFAASRDGAVKALVERLLDTLRG